MKIIIPGILPQTKTYDAVCGNCGCHFTFTRHEAEYISHPRGADELRAKCPQTGCGQDCRVTA